MMQRLLTPLACGCCGNDYYETGYWRDGELCLSCSANARRQEEDRKKELLQRAAEISEKHGLDLDQYPPELPEDLRRELNPRNAGRKAVKYCDEYGELLIEDASEGKTEAEFAAKIRVTQSLLQHWTARHPRFKKAREIANEVREAWFEKYFRLGMTGKLPCNASMMIRYGSAKYGWREKSDTVVGGGGGEIPVVKVVERDAGFPAQTLEPTKEQAAAAGVEA